MQRPLISATTLSLSATPLSFPPRVRRIFHLPATTLMAAPGQSPYAPRILSRLRGPGSERTMSAKISGTENFARQTIHSEFWGSLAPHHSAIENTNLDLPSIRRILHQIHQPVLVVGAGQGLIVEELQKNGLRCDGVDLNLEMIR